MNILLCDVCICFHKGYIVLSYVEIDTNDIFLKVNKFVCDVWINLNDAKSETKNSIFVILYMLASFWKVFSPLHFSFPALSPLSRSPAPAY